MAKQGNIRFGIGFDVDKSGLEQLKSSLASLSHINKFDLVDGNASIKELEEIKRVAGQVGTALQSSFNKDLGTYNIQTFKKALADAGLSTQTISKTFAQAGEKGKIAFRNMANAVSSTKLELRETHSLLDKMGSTLANTIRWSIASTAINAVTGSIQKAWSFTKNLDASLNDIMIVTGKSAEEMDKFAVKANNAAKALGSNTKAYTDAALIYYQQGLSDEDAQARASVTVKAANVTGQSAQAVSEQLTAVWNGYKVSAAESEKYIDKLAAVAASTAADLEELSVGMSRVASAANIMGVDIDQLNAQLATIVSVTREAPESIGTALKTVYARMSDIQAGIDSETTLGEYTTQMAEMGINVLNAQGKLRDMGDVVEEIGNKWSSLNREQQTSLAQSIAGTRQYSRMMALFDNWDQYQEALTTSQASIGTLQKQQDIYMESLEAHLNQLTAKSETLYSKLFDSDSFKSFIDIAGGAVEVLANFVESLGGGGSLLLTILPLLTNVFSKHLASGLATTITNFQNVRENALMLKNALDGIRTFKIDGIDTVTRQFIDLRENVNLLRQQGLLTNEQFNDFNKEISNYLELAQKASEIRVTNQAIDKRMDKGADIGTKVRIKDISDTAATGDQEATQKKLAEYQLNLGDRQAMFTEATQPLNIQFAEDASYDQKLEALTRYMEAYKQAAQESGLVSEEQIQDLELEIQKIKEATTAAQDKRKEHLAELESQKAELTADITVYSEGEELTAEEQKALELKHQQIDALEKEIGVVKRSIQVYENQENTIRRLSQSAEKAGKKTTAAVEQGAAQAEAAGKQAATGLEHAFDQHSKQAANKIVKNLKKINLTGTIQQVTKTTSAIGQMASAINIVSNLGNIWSNEDLSIGQKTLQTIMNMTTALGMMMPALGLAKTMYDAFTLSKKANAAVSALVAAGETKEGAAKALNAIASLSGAAATSLLEESKEKLNAETYEAVAANLAQGGSIGALAAAEIAAVAPTAALTAAKTAETGAVAANSAAWYSNPIMWIALIVVGAIAAIVGLVAGIVALTKALDEEAQAQKELENATAHANEMADAFANAKKEYDDLKASIEDYKNAQKAIDELAAGTEEWSQAIAESNNQVMELIKKYPELAQYMSNEGGRLTLSEEGLESVLAQEQAEVNESQRMALLAQSRQAEAKRNLTNVRVHDELEGASTGEGAANGAIAGAAAGAAIGSFIPVLGTAIGAIIGTAAGAITGAIVASDEMSQEDTQELADILAKSPDAFADEEAFARALDGTEFEDMTNELWENRQALEELTQATKAAEAEQAALRQQIALSMLAETETYKAQQEAYAKAEKEKNEIKREDYDSAEDYYKARAEKQAEMDDAQKEIDLYTDFNSSKAAEDARKKKVEDDLKKDLEGEDIYDPTEWSDEQKEKYVKEYYSKLYDIDESDVTLGSDEDGSNFSIKYIDKNGKQQEIDEDMLSWEDFANNLVDQRIAAVTLSDKDLTDQKDKFEKMTAEDQEAFRSFIGDAQGSFSDLTTEQFEAAAGMWKDVEWEDVEADSALKEELKAKAEALGLETTDEALKELLKGITSAVDNYEKQEQKINDLFLGRNTIGGENSIFDDEESLNTFNSFSQSTRLKWANLWSDLAMSTEEGSEIMNTLMSNMTSENAGLINAAFDDVDWTDPKSIKNFNEAMIETGMSAEESAELVYQMRYAMGAIEDFNVDKATSKFTTLQKTLDAINETGDTIDADMYDALADDMKEYFVRMGDGTYKLIGSAEAFKAAAEAAHKASLWAQLDEQRKKQKDDFASKTTLTKEEKDKIKQDENTKADQEVVKYGKSYSRGSFTSYSDLGDGFFGETGEWFVSTFTGKGLDGRVPIENIAAANEALNGIRRYKEELGISDDTINDWQSQITGGNMWEKDFDAFLDAAGKVKEKAEARAQSYRDGADAKVAEEENKRKNENEGAKLTISESEKDAVTQLYGEASSLAEIAEVDAKIDEMYSDANGYTQADRDALKGIGKNYTTAFKNEVANFDAGVDVYRDVEKELEKIEQQMDELANGSKMLVEGSEAWLANMQQQNALLDKQIAKQRTLKTTAEAEKQEATTELDNKAKVTKTVQNDDGTFTTTTLKDFNIYRADGTLKTRDELLQEVEDYVQSAGADVVDLDVINGMIDDINNTYDKIDEADEKMADATSAIRDAMMTQLENNLSMFEAKLQLEIDETEFKRTFNDFKNSFIKEDDFLGLGGSLGASFNLAKDDVKTYTDALDELNRKTVLTDAELNSIIASGGTIAEGAISQADYEAQKQELLNSLMESGLSLQEAQAAMLENIVAYHEKMNELYDNYVSLIENVNSALDHQRTLMELMYGDKAYQHMESYYTAQVNNLQSITSVRKTQMNENYANMLSATSDEERQALQDAYLESADTYFSALNDLAAMRQEQYLNELDRRFDEAFGEFDKKKNDFDWEVSSSKDFLNPLDAAFGIQSVERAFDKSINVNTSISAQAKLNKLRDEELAKLRDKDKLTKYDLDRAQKRLAIAQAEIALQEAQANKSKMRLVRGTDGTYSYQYEADIDAISKAEEDLAKANQDLVDLDNKELESQLNNAYQLWEEYKQKLTELDPHDQEAINELTDRYSARISALGSKAEEAFANLDSSVASAAELLGQDISIDVVASWATGDFAQAIFNFDDFDWTAFGAGIQGAAAEANADIVDIQGELEAALTTYLATLQGEDGLIANAKAEIDSTKLAADELDNLRVSAQNAAKWLEALIGAEGGITATVEGEVGNVSTTVNFPGVSAETGMYTGEWGAEGRLAMLHEKELVLNKADTSNILAAVDIVRQLENALSSSLLGQILGLTANGYAGSLEGLRKLGELKQNVNITAEFPNATDKNEIEAAFDELINLATQKIYETR